jgi:hypothetical protein
VQALEQAHGGPVYANSYALVIGINKYPQGSVFRRLNFAVDDANSVEYLLTSFYGFPEENVILLIDSLVSTTCPATCGTGAAVSSEDIRIRQRMVERMRQIPAAVLCAAVRGTSTRTTSARRTATAAAPRRTAATAAGFGVLLWQESLGV